MPYYHKLGQVPHKRHTVFRREDGQLYSEHLMGSLGFSGPASLLYHIHPPTRVLATKKLRDVKIEREGDASLRMRHFHLSEVTPAKSPTLDRTPVLFNADVTISKVHPSGSDDFFYRNGQADEIVYVSRGSGAWFMSSDSGHNRRGGGSRILSGLDASFTGVALFESMLRSR